MKKNKSNVEIDAKHFLMFRCVMAGSIYTLDIAFIITFIETMLKDDLLNKIIFLGISIFMFYFSRNIYYDLKREFLTEKINHIR